MPRDVSGVYTLPAGNPVVTGTTISSTWGNTTLSDIATALTNSLSIDGSVTAAKIATNAVTTVKILDGNVTEAKLADDAVTADKLASDAVVTASIVDGNVTAAKLATDAVTAVKIAADAVTTVKILDANVTAAKLATNAVTAVKIAADAVTTAKILDANVTAAKLASNAVTTAKILDANVTSAKLQDSITLGGTVTLSGGKLTFPAAQAASANANTLDDYEEGTWTPTITFATPGNLNVVYTLREGHYTKIGNRVFLHVTVATSTFTHTTASGIFRMTGFPFTISGNSFNAFAAHRGVNGSGMEYLDLTLLDGGTAGQFLYGGGGSTADVTVTEVPTGSVVNLFSNLTYKTA